MSHTIDLIFTTGIKFWFKTNTLDPHHRHHNHPHQHDNQVPSCNRANLLLVLLHRIHGSSKMVGIDNYFNLDYLINTLCLILGSWWWTLWFTASCTPTMLSGPWGCPLQSQYLILFAFIHNIHFCSFPELGFSVKVSTTKGSGHADYITAGFKSRQNDTLFLGFEIYNNLYTLKVRKNIFT